MRRLYCPSLIAIALLWFVPAICLASSQPGIPESSHAEISAQDSSAIGLVLERYAKSVLPPQPKELAGLHQLAQHYASVLNADGSWADIHYGDKSRSSWQVTEHLNRTLVMAKWARAARGAGTPDSNIEIDIHHALDYWLKYDPKNRNWWWNEIGVPELLGEIAALTEKQLPQSTILNVTKIMRRSNWARVPWTGANLVWGVEIEIVRGCLEHNDADVREGYSRMYQEIKIVGPHQDGIQQDYSFHQHGEQLYSGGYGLSYANDVGRFVAYAWGTKFQIPAKQLAIFSAYILDGEQWMTTGDIIDYSTIGREITRKGLVVAPTNWDNGPISRAGAAYSLAHVVNMLAALPTPRQTEFRAFAARLLQLPKLKPFIGNKQFWCSDFMVQRSANYTTSVKMLSNRMQNAEVINGEGLKSQHLSDGVNFLYLTGDEYRDIFPVWDWTKLPGTTAIQNTLDTGEKNPINTHGVSSFAGGVSDGTYGMAAMDLARGNLVAKKAWFFFGRYYVALGADITLSGSDDVATDVNQSRLHGAVFSNLSSQPLLQGKQNFDKGRLRWLYHDRVGYIVAHNANVKLSLGLQAGRWSDIGAGSSEEVSISVFNLWLDHGEAPKAASYEYAVLPGVSLRQTKQFASTPPYTVFSNTAAIQGVYDSRLKMVEIAFRQPAKARTPLGAITVDHACLLIARRVGDSWVVTAANPENLPLNLGMTIGSKKIRLSLPDRWDAGSSVTQTLSAP